MTDALSKSIKSTENELSFAGRGLKGNNADDVKEICDAIEAYRPLEALRLEGNTINEAAAAAIGQALEKRVEIKRLIWNDLFTTRLKTEVPPSLKNLTNGLITNGCHIVELNLSDNAFGPIGVEGLQTFLSSEACYTLEELRLNNCGMGIGGGKLLAETLIQCHKNSGGKFSLKQFVAGRNRLENEGSQALSTAFEIIGTLEVIRMPQNGIRPPGIEALTNAFVKNENLRFIDLNDNIITLAAPKLASAIEKLPKLEIINLESSLIRSRGGIAIARAIVSHKNLQELYLGCNEINTEAGLEIAHVVKNMQSLKILDLNGNCFGGDGIDEIRHELENSSFVDQMRFSDDEGSEDDDDDEGGRGDVENEEEYDDEDNDDDYEDEEEIDDEDDAESPSFFFGKSPTSQQPFDAFSKTPMKLFSNEPRTDSGLAHMIANFNVCSPFRFGQSTTNNTNNNQWTIFTDIKQVAEHIKNNEHSVECSIKLLEGIWNDKSISQADSSLITGNILKTLLVKHDNESDFNQRLSVVLGLLKDEQIGRHRSIKDNYEKMFKTLIDVNNLLPKSTKQLLSLLLQNPTNDKNQYSPEIKQQLISALTK